MCLERMTIIRPGELHPEKLCGTCERCGCEVEVTAEECKTENAPLAFNVTQEETRNFVDCPTQFCGEQIRIYAR